MALELIIQTAVTGIQALVLFILSLPAHRVYRNFIVSTTKKVLHAFTFFVLFSLFQLADGYIKLVSKIKCHGEVCAPGEWDRIDRSRLKNEKKIILAIASILMYWLMWRLCSLEEKLSRLERAAPPPVEKKQE